jgi:hypothetical protein
MHACRGQREEWERGREREGEIDDGEIERGKEEEWSEHTFDFASFFSCDISSLPSVISYLKLRCTYLKLYCLANCRLS